MRVLVHDYAGHPFPVQLSRELARRGHELLHLHFLDLQTPKGNLHKRADDPVTFDVVGISLGEPFRKWSSLIRRRRQELRYARCAAERLRRYRPDVVLSANTPLEVQAIIHSACREVGARLVIWVQDFYSIAVETLLTRKLGLPGRLIGRYYRRIERKLLNECDQIIYITEDFFDIARGCEIDVSKCHVIENWSPLDEIIPCDRDNAWARSHGLTGKLCILYAGTMGLKHNPALLLELAESWRDHEEVVVVVVSEGPGRTWLEAQRAKRQLSNLKLLDFQPYEQLSEVLASGDILVALLERDAGVFAVPSKVLSYMCVGRPLLLAVPKGNLAGRTVEQGGAGLVVEPDDGAGLDRCARRLIHDPDLRTSLGRNARRYALANFDIEKIGDRFEAILDTRGALAKSERHGHTGMSRNRTVRRERTL